MARRPYRRGRAHRQRRDRARYRPESTRQGRRVDTLLRRGISFGAGRRRAAENGLSARVFDDRRLEGLAGKRISNRKMKIDFDFAYDHPCYRPRFPEELFDRLAGRFGIGQRGQTLLDLGTGSGTVARAYARRGCVVTGLDPEAVQLEEAKRLTQQGG